MPTQGLAHSTIYYRVSDPAAIRYLQEFTKRGESIDRNYLRNTYEQSYTQATFSNYNTIDSSTETIIVEYELKYGIECDDLPKSFSVVINRKTRKTEILSEKNIQQEPK
jgi:hypothetical protein